MLQTFQMWFTTTFYEFFQIIERIYDDRIPPTCTQKLIKFAKKLKHENISTKPLYKLFSVVHNYFVCIFQIIERIHDDDPIAQNNLEKLRKTGNLKM